MPRTRSVLPLLAAALALFVVGIAALNGCSTDVTKEMTADTATQAKVMDTIASNPEMAGAMMDRLMFASDTARAVVAERIMSNILMKQAMTSRMSKDPASMDMLVSMPVGGDSTMHQGQVLDRELHSVENSPAERGRQVNHAFRPRIPSRGRSNRLLMLTLA